MVKKLQRLLIKPSYTLLNINKVSYLFHSSKQDDYPPHHNEGYTQYMKKTSFNSF